MAQLLEWIFDNKSIMENFPDNLSLKILDLKTKSIYKHY